MTNRMNLAGRIFLSGVSLVGLLKTAGCATEEEAKVCSLIGTMGMVSPNVTPNQAVGYAGLKDISLNSINAEKSGAQVNIYNGQVIEQNVQSNVPEIEHLWIGFDNRTYGQVPKESNLYYFDNQREKRWIKSSFKVEDAQDKRLFPRFIR